MGIEYGAGCHLSKLSTSRAAAGQGSTSLSLLRTFTQPAAIDKKEPRPRPAHVARRRHSIVPAAVLLSRRESKHRAALTPRQFIMEIGRLLRKGRGRARGRGDRRLFSFFLTRQQSVLLHEIAARLAARNNRHRSMRRHAVHSGATRFPCFVIAGKSNEIIDLMPCMQETSGRGAPPRDGDSTAERAAAQGRRRIRRHLPAVSQDEIRGRSGPRVSLLQRALLCPLRRQSRSPLIESESPSLVFAIHFSFLSHILHQTLFPAFICIGSWFITFFVHA